MKRIYYLTQTAALASEVFHSIEQSGIALKKHVVISDDKESIKEHDLKLANLFQRRDILRYIELGMLGGLLGGLVLALLTVIFPPKGMEITPYSFILEVFSIGFFGVAIGFLLGVSKDNFSIAEFRDQLDRKEFILLVDVEDNQYEQINHVMTTQFAHVIKLKEDPKELTLLSENLDEAA
ncbi:MAG: hypothetical protein COB04_17310 [Gammaproteobacteria bacterium]|nr:MAG: hypothetical protein COB04_17310 [Gammaproteobacteria bacterium]